MTTEVLVQGALLGIDSYKDWLANEKIPVATGLAVDLFAFETGDWPRYGVKGGATHLLLIEKNEFAVGLEFE